MKKLTAVFFMFSISAASCFAADKSAVYLKLDEEPAAPKAQTVQTVQNNSFIFDDAVLRKKQIDNFIYNDEEKIKQKNSSVSKSLEKKVTKDVSLGAGYSAGEKTGKLNDTVNVYSKYQKEKFGIAAGYSQDRASLQENGISGGTASISPEFTVNRHIKLKNTFSENMSSGQQKTEAGVSVTPFKDDRLNLDMGMAEVFSSGNEPAKSQVNAGLKFKF